VRPGRRVRLRNSGGEKRNAFHTCSSFEPEGKRATKDLVRREEEVGEKRAILRQKREERPGSEKGDTSSQCDRSKSVLKKGSMHL